MTVELFAFVVFAVVALFLVGSVVGYRSGVEPLKKLKPIAGTYRVDAVLARDDGFHRLRLVVSWHVDYGHREQRIAQLPRFWFSMEPAVGDELRVIRRGGDDLEYVVARPVAVRPAVGVGC